MKKYILGLLIISGCTFLDEPGGQFEITQKLASDTTFVHTATCEKVSWLSECGQTLINCSDGIGNKHNYGCNGSYATAISATWKRLK